MLFGLPPIYGLLPLLIYIVLAFKKGMHPLVNVAICVLFSAVLTQQPLGKLGGVIYSTMGSFLALVGLIIMLGSGLGVVLRKTGVADNIVNILMRKIGVTTQKRAIIATMVCSVVLVTLLGTLAGANAIIAPIVIPLVAAVGICPATLAVIFQGAGQTGLFLSPFSPPMVTLMGISGLSYPQVLLCAGIPISLIMWLGVYFVALSIQKHNDGSEIFEGVTAVNAEYKPAPATQRATVAFLITMALLVVYGIWTKGGASFVILVMLTASIVTGVAGGLSLGATFDAIMEGCGKLFWLYFMFLLFNPFLDFVVKSGAFAALVEMLKPYIASSGKLGFSLLTAFVGVFGINGAAVAQAMMMNEMFSGFLAPMGISMQLWVLIVLVGHQITSFAYPGLDMIGQMGLAHAKDVKPMLKLAYLAIIPGTFLAVAVGSYLL